MTDWKRQIGAITLYVSDLGEARKFYSDAFGLDAQPLDDDTAMLRFEGICVFLHQSSMAAQPLTEVLEDAWKGVGQFAIIVDDVDAVCAEIAGRGVQPLTGPADRDWRHADGDLRRPELPHLGDRPGTSLCGRLTCRVAELVQARRAGRERRFTICADRLAQARRQMVRVTSRGDERLAAIKRIAEAAHSASHATDAE